MNVCTFIICLSMHLDIIQPFMVWLVSSTCWLLWIVPLWTYKYINISFSTCLQFSWVYTYCCHMIILCLTFWAITQVFSTVAAPSYIPNSNVQVFQFLHILTDICNFPFVCGRQNNAPLPRCLSPDPWNLPMSVYKERVNFQR